MPKKITTEEWIEKAKKVHGDLYDYSRVEYTGALNKVNIECRVHGVFSQVASKHTNDKCGCPECSKGKGFKVAAEKKKGTTKITVEDFLKKARAVHGDKFTYLKTEYTGVDNKVTITCPEHGDFEQVAYSHLNGNGCKKCADKCIKKNRKNSHNTWRFSGWKAAGEASENFQGFSLYVIECSSKTTGERFIKVGKTFVGVGKRFARRMPYKFKVLVEVFHDAYAISRLESQIKAAFKEAAYTPSRPFDGQHECLNLDVKEAVVTMAED